MDLELFTLLGLEWLSDRVENRFGRAAAWVATLVLASAMIGELVLVLMVLASTKR